MNQQIETNSLLHLSPNRRAWLRFKSNKRGLISLWVFCCLFFLSLFAEMLCNDKPLIIQFEGGYYFPFVQTYPETTFGGDFETEADYADVFVNELITRGDNWAIFPPVKYSYNTINFLNVAPNPAPPSEDNIFGTDDRGRDVFSRLVYGFRISVLFAFALTAIGVVIGIVMGSIQGYFSGKTDLFMQRVIEVWSSMPELYLLIIFASIFEPSIWLLLILLSLFGWMGLSDYVRAEFLRGRNMDYVRAARAMGLSNYAIMKNHLLPNSMTPVITFLPFRISGSILALTSLDFLGLGVPPTTPSLGELLSQGKENIEAWWLSLGAFIVLVGTLMLLIFIGEALREALDTRKA